MRYRFILEVRKLTRISPAAWDINREPRITGNRSSEATCCFNGNNQSWA